MIRKLRIYAASLSITRIQCNILVYWPNLNSASNYQLLFMPADHYRAVTNIQKNAHTLKPIFKNVQFGHVE